eukprot:COSAG03_NODE_15034_length_443_cov_0.729651_2_plen_101_part_01
MKSFTRVKGQLRSALRRAHRDADGGQIVTVETETEAAPTVGDQISHNRISGSRLEHKRSVAKRHFAAHKIDAAACVWQLIALLVGFVLCAWGAIDCAHKSL